MPGTTTITSPAESPAPPAPPAKHHWTSLGATVRGKSHVATGLENQDAIKISLRDDTHPVAAVADGHGDARCFRSGAGSRLAVEVAVAVLEEFVARPVESADATAREARETLPQLLEQQWNDAVLQHLKDHPLTPAELEYSIPWKADMEDNPRIPYGTTLLAAAVTPHYALYLQIGDGDFIVISEKDLLDRAVPTDEQSGGAATSLCMRDSRRHFRMIFQDGAAGLPVFVSLSTDGVCNSFEKSADFDAFVARQLDLLRGPDGSAAVRGSLESNLSYMTEKGSSDDVTWVMFKRSEPHDFDTLATGLQQAQTELRDVRGQLPTKASQDDVQGLCARITQMEVTLNSVSEKLARLYAGVATERAGLPRPSPPGTEGRRVNKSAGDPLARLLDRNSFFTWFALGMSATACAAVMWLSSSAHGSAPTEAALPSNPTAAHDSAPRGIEAVSGRASPLHHANP